MNLRPVRLLAGSVIALCAIVAPPASTRAGAAPVCAATAVTVVVDFKALGGGVQRGRAADPKSGIEALQQAGFSVTGTTQYGLAFVCRLDGKPANDPCTSTPPASTYWAYYHAKPTDSGWTYGNVSALYYDPAPGTIEAWSFGARTQPSITPAAAAETTPPPTTSAPPPTQAPPVTQPPTGPGTTAGPTGPGATVGSQPGRPSATGTNANSGPGATNASGSGTALTPPTDPVTGKPTATPAADAKKTAKETKAAAAKAARDKRSGPTTSAPHGEGETRIIERSSVATTPAPDNGSPLPALAAAFLIGVLGVGAWFFA